MLETTRWWACRGYCFTYATRTTTAARPNESEEHPAGGDGQKGGGMKLNNRAFEHAKGLIRGGHVVVDERDAGALDEVAWLAREWFERYLTTTEVSSGTENPSGCRASTRRETIDSSGS
jgi:hypothetical protein